MYKLKESMISEYNRQHSYSTKLSEIQVQVVLNFVMFYIFFIQQIELVLDCTYNHVI